ncbi:hypothetical protein B5E64_05725 [Drancourtella sp. An12]|uniref:STAS-like domain-containing protein n=1 Tax=Drancourtella sp. An12 TaxID=1965548 RepID=UPI000B3A7D69|nr:STAS-like domain-containing protein [Drancourtella sp. An12]OUQ46257.1 hypothetical protein B5E64_05725 [Drancourtella sp. An12]
MSKIIDVAEVIGSPSALTQEQGEKIYSIITDSMSREEGVTLDFENVESMISPFLNTAIGQLYGSFSPEIISSYLHVENFPDAKQSTLKIVIDNAKKYYSNKERYTTTVKDVIG